ncbi:restriction endonuclease subunit S [Dehalococcoides mccartyi]|uniref:Type I restriction enzyme, specificity protein n=1 Tax=Dehalococcoides mccartyi (strain CBDB1) TaxID=255470 RepID=A0A916KLC4_DEHMC|nr:restriction endonuclease subunit S [Dehalococcoides mccartyi]CAI82369.1 putative type I restriction enzyme, specificity protein [Dehalococcoides mccartyi CBDB1]
MTKFSRQEYIIYDLPLLSYAASCKWPVKTVGDIAKVIGGGTPDTGVPQYWNPAEIPWATPTDITSCKGIYINKTERNISQMGLQSCSATLLPQNSCLLTSRATIGECRINTIPMATNQGFAALVPKAGTNSYFLFYLTYLLKPTFVRLAAGTTYTEISKRELRRVKCRVPETEEEQAKIANVIKAVDDALACTPDESLMLMRTSLVQNLMTGKVYLKPEASK